MAADSRFPLTRHSLVAAARSQDDTTRRVAWEELVTAYWRPVYKYLRLQWHADSELAQDWTQEFFARALENGYFASFDSTRARFRTFLRVCLDGFASKQRSAARAQKRGGGTTLLSLDFAAAEGELAGTEPPAPDGVDAYFHREWMRSLFSLAIDDLRRICTDEDKVRHFAVFQRYDLEGPERTAPISYADVAGEFGIPVTQVTNWLHWARGRLRECLLTRLGRLCATDEEFRAEARALLGGSDP